MAKTETAIAKFEPDKYLLLKTPPEKLKKLAETNLGGKSLKLFDMPRAAVPSGGLPYWTLKPEIGEPPKEIKGIMLQILDWRAFWQVPYEESGGGTPPDCSSTDTLTGYGNRHLPDDDPEGQHDCLTCPHAQWNTDPKGGKGQHCKEMRVVLILTEQSILPTVILAPPTSLKAIDGMRTMLFGQLAELTTREVTLTLEKDTNDRGVDYSKINVAIGNEVPVDKHELIEKWAAVITGSSTNFEPGDIKQGDV